MEILVVYKSKTGFAQKYANIISQKLNAKVMDLDSVCVEDLAKADTVIYGGGLYKGTLNGLNKMKELYKNSKAQNLIIFAVGANPNERADVINRSWNKNLDENELKLYPHFYMQGGINYEKMDFMSRFMMKMFSKMIMKKAQSDIDKKFAQIISKSCDISDEKFAEDLINCVKNLDK